MENRKNLAIVGLGLLGGSLGLALANSGWRRLGWSRRPETGQEALKMGAVDEAPESLAETLRQADITVLATPLEPTMAILHDHAGDWQPGSLVTDLGSLKQQIVTVAEKALSGTGVHFVGSHPMAGTEKSGLANSFAELYNNADVFLCPASGTPDQIVHVMADFWEQLSCRSHVMESAPHDHLVARTSHVLHILASMLARSILKADNEQEKHERFCGCATGFRDISRIAASSPAMW
ncbi:MAG: prephenate dehydrogenase/arogenate dehydrogenase family protein, partial [Chloroflexi bacterium]|nr:prephenate dehydrogenase/arogenate dehydrogenase family protein [Chloroflexota bacterium]